MKTVSALLLSVSGSTDLYVHNKPYSESSRNHHGKSKMIFSRHSTVVSGNIPWEHTASGTETVYLYEPSIYFYESSDVELIHELNNHLVRYPMNTDLVMIQKQNHSEQQFGDRSKTNSNPQHQRVLEYQDDLGVVWTEIMNFVNCFRLRSPFSRCSKTRKRAGSGFSAPKLAEWTTNVIQAMASWNKTSSMYRRAHVHLLSLHRNLSVLQSAFLEHLSNQDIAARSALKTGGMPPECTVEVSWDIISLLFDLYVFCMGGLVQMQGQEMQSKYRHYSEHAMLSIDIHENQQKLKAIINDTAHDLWQFVMDRNVLSRTRALRWERALWRRSNTWALFQTAIDIAHGVSAWKAEPDLAEYDIHITKAGLWNDKKCHMLDLAMKPLLMSTSSKFIKYRVYKLDADTVYHPNRSVLFNAFQLERF